MSEENSEAYSIIKISLKTRIINIVLIVVIFFGTSGFILFTLIKDKRHIDYEAVAWIAFIFLLGCYMLWNNLKPTNKKSLSGTWVTQQPAINKMKIYALLLMGVISTGFSIWLFFKTRDDAETAATVIACLAIALFALGGYLYLEIKPKKVFVLSEAAQFEQLRLQSEKALVDEENAKQSIEEAEKWALIEERWWYRYGVATLILIGAWGLHEYKPNLWWVSLIAILAAMVYTRELSIFIIGIIAIWLIFQGLASLSVTGAILIGACIIAFAIYSNK